MVAKDKIKKAMTYIRKIGLIIVILSIAVTGIIQAQSEGEEIGQVKQIDHKRGQIIISTSINVSMGDELYIRIDGKVVQLIAIFSVESLTKCRPKGKNKDLAMNALLKMPVYRWNKSIEDVEKSNESNIKTDATNKRVRMPSVQ